LAPLSPPSPPPPPHTHPQVYLAKWRETTVAVKVLGAMGSASAPGLDDEFPDAAAAKRHPLHESLQKVRRAVQGWRGRRVQHAGQAWGRSGGVQSLRSPRRLGALCLPAP
jgi:hypothetical protein